MPLNSRLGRISKPWGTPAKKQNLSKTTNNIFMLFLLSASTLELQLPREPINISNIIVFLSALVAIYYGSKHRIFLKTRSSVYKPAIYSFILFAVYGMVTAIWSPVSVDTLFQSTLLLLTLAACVSLEDTNPSTLARHVVALAAVYAILSFLVIPVSPAFAFQPSSSTGGAELRGVFFHQQRSGLFMVIALGFFAILTANREWGTKSGRPSRMHILWLLPIILCLIASAARSYSAFLILSLATTFLLGRKGQIRYVGILFFFIVGLTLLLSLQYIPEILNESDVDLTLTGRTMVWTRSIIVANEKWLEGWGFGSYFSNVFDYIWGNYRPPHAHSTFVNTYFETGVIGLSLLSMSILLQIFASIRNADRSHKHSFGLYLSILALLCGLTGTFYGGKMSFLIIVTVSAICSESRVAMVRKEQSMLSKMDN